MTPEEKKEKARERAKYAREKRKSEFQEKERMILYNPEHQDDQLDYEKAKKDYAELPPAQRVFIEQFLRTGNGAKSALIAGYKPSSAKQQAALLHKMPRIKNILKCRQAQIAGALAITRESLLMDLVDEKDLARKEKRTGDVCKAIDLIAKLLAYFDTRLLSLERTSDKPATIKVSEPTQTDGEGKVKKMGKALDFDQPLEKEGDFFIGNLDEKEEDEE